MPHSKTCVSGNSFLEGSFSGDILLVGLLKKEWLRHNEQDEPQCEVVSICQRDKFWLY